MICRPTFARARYQFLGSGLRLAAYIERQVIHSLCLAKILDIADSDAQFALAHSRLFGDRKIDRQEQISVRLGCFERTSLPIAAKRTPGAVGTLNVAGRRGEVVILREYGGGTRVVSNRSLNTCIGDLEYVSPKSPRKLFLPTRLYLPYGVWTESDGAQVLFSRDYLPLWQVRKDGLIERVEPWLWIKWTEQKWFWDDGNTPWDSQRQSQKVEGIFGSVQDKQRTASRRCTTVSSS